MSDRCLINLFNFHLFFTDSSIQFSLRVCLCAVCCVLCVVCWRRANSFRRRRVRDARRRDERIPLGAARTVGRGRADDQGIRPQTEVAHTHSRTTLLYTSYSLYSSRTPPTLNQCFCLYYTLIYYTRYSAAAYYSIASSFSTTAYYSYQPISLSASQPLLYRPVRSSWLDGYGCSALCSLCIAPRDQP